MEDPQTPILTIQQLMDTETQLTLPTICVAYPKCFKYCGKIVSFSGSP